MPHEKTPKLQLQCLLCDWSSARKTKTEKLARETKTNHALSCVQGDNGLMKQDQHKASAKVEICRVLLKSAEGHPAYLNGSGKLSRGKCHMRCVLKFEQKLTR